MPDPTNTACGAELHHERRVGRRRDASRAEQRHGQLAGLGDLLHQADRRAQLLRPVVELGRIGLRDLADVTEDRPQVPHRFDDVAGASLALRADHRRPLGDAPQRLAQVRRAAHERHRERPLVDVVRLVGRREHLTLVHVVDTERLEDLRFSEVTDAGLCHHRDRDHGLDALDHLRVAHASHTAIAADVGRHSLERHHRAGTGVFGDLGLIRGDDVHDDAALQHLGQPALHRERARRTSHDAILLAATPPTPSRLTTRRTMRPLNHQSRGGGVAVSRGR